MPEEVFIIIVVAMVVGVPVLGLTVRMVAKSVVEALANLKSPGDRDGVGPAGQQRMLMLEEEVDGLRKSVERLEEEVRFQQALSSPPSSEARAIEAPKEEPTPGSS
jgi:hypothetical protein